VAAVTDEPRRPLLPIPGVDAFVRLTPDATVDASADDGQVVVSQPYMEAGADGVFHRNSIVIPISREMAIDFGLVEPTPEEVIAREKQRAETERRVAEQRAVPGPELTLGTLLAKLEWSPAYARHWLHPACWCYPFDEDPLLCSWARELGFTEIGGQPS
jgi:hypothetical protein